MALSDRRGRIDVPARGFRYRSSSLASTSAVRVAIEVAAFAAAAAALAAVGRVGLAIVFAVLAGINEILNYILD